MLRCIECSYFFEGTCTRSGEYVTPDNPKTCDGFSDEERSDSLRMSRSELLALHSKIISIKTVPDGKWVYGVCEGVAQWYCSNCKKPAYWDTDYGQQLFDFCQCCGAKMENTEGVP